jgi:hypothetical protein
VTPAKTGVRSVWKISTTLQLNSRQCHPIQTRSKRTAGWCYRLVYGESPSHETTAESPVESGCDASSPGSPRPFVRRSGRQASRGERPHLHSDEGGNAGSRPRWNLFSERRELRAGRQTGTDVRRPASPLAMAFTMKGQRYPFRGRSFQPKTKVAHRKRAGSRGAAAPDLMPCGAPSNGSDGPYSPVRAVRASPGNRSQERARLRPASVDINSGSELEA